MFRITIDNEEVLCDKDITIKKEMLNTPSVILNNVFPKTWESSKDYTTNFYHPNDYSKCVIADEDYIEESDGTTVEGSNLSINYDDRRNFEYNLKGDTYQYTTPTPDSPQEVVNATGRQEISVCGKNLFNVHEGNTLTSVNVLFTRNSDGTITLNGTSNNTGFIEILYAFQNGTSTQNSIYLPLDSSSTYTASFKQIKGTTSSTDIRFITQYDSTGNQKTIYVNNSQTISGSNGLYRAYIRIPSGITFNNYTVGIQLEKGTQASTFEAYKGNTYEINLGKNLSPQSTMSTMGGGYINASTGHLGNVIKGETYTLSLYNNSNYTNQIVLRVFYDNTYANQMQKNLIANSITTFTFTASNDGYVALSGKVAEDKTDLFTNIQLEKGTQATSYSHYKTPIELCKIGNYQDKIFKDTKNKFNYNQNILNNANFGSGALVNDNTCTLSYVECEPNTTYTISRRAPMTQRFWVATTDTVPSVNVAISNVHQVSNNTTTSITITTGANSHYIVMRFIQNKNDDYETYAKTIQVEFGGSATDYEEFGIQKWYICKKIEKVVLNGSESGWGDRPNYTYADRFVEATILTNRTPKTNNLGYSNYFVVKGVDKNEYPYVSPNGTQIVVNYSAKGTTTLADFKTWLSTHPLEVYYVLNTPTYIGIEDEELISQLESIRLWNGLNNITTSSPYLPAIMNLHYNFNEAFYYMNQLFFSGVVKNSGNISLNPREPHFQTLQILDFKTFLSEGETLDRVIVNKTILETIQEVVGVISGYGFVLGNVQIANPDDIIGAYSTENKTAYDIFNYIAEITQSKWTTRLVDENTVAIDFYDPSALPQGTPIEYNTTYFKDNLIDNMFYSYSSNDYRNKQIMTSKEVFANIDTKETIISSGYGNTFLVEQPIGQIESIKLNNVEMSFATKQDKELGYSADFYYSVGSNSIESDINIPLGSSIVIQYIPIVSGRQVISNDSEISRISGSTGRNGIITRYENRNDASTSTELQMIGQSYIKYKGSPEIKLTVETRSNLWEIGERVQFNAPMPELATEYMVKSKKIQYIPTIDEIFYTFEMSSSFNSEQDINYFDNQRAKAQGNIKEGSYISRNIDIENVANITFQNVSIEKINSTGDNKLNSTLNSPIVQ